MQCSLCENDGWQHHRGELLRVMLSCEPEVPAANELALVPV